MTVGAIDSHVAAERALIDLWADCRDDPAMPDAVKEQLAQLLTSGGALERKVIAAELVLAHADHFSADCRLRAAALADFAVAHDFFSMATSGRGAAIAAALRDTPGAQPVEPLARFVPPLLEEGDAELPVPEE